MTTSPETNALNHPALRALVDAANALPLADQTTLLKGLVPDVARQISPEEFNALISELRLKGERYYEAVNHPGQGRESRRVIGERDLEGR